MNASNVFKRNQATLKLVFVGLLSLAMLVPLMMVRSIIDERQSVQYSAQQTIASRWGGSQSLGGLVALTRTLVKTSDGDGARIQKTWRASVLSDLDIAVSLTTEQRYLGIYEVPVYTSSVTIKGRLDWSSIDEFQPEGELLLWLPLGDVRGVREVSSLTLGGMEVAAKPLGVDVNGNRGLQFTVAEADRGQGKDQYQLKLKLAGSEALIFLPLADTTRVRLESNWPHPEFIGQFLPSQKSITADGTTASWQLLGLIRPFSDQWTLIEMTPHQLNLSGFGMRLEVPVDVYQRSERSVKYGALFIALTFFTLFLFEVMTGRPLHPVPYFLTGAALAVFYLMLLALSEYVPFYMAFMIAAGLLVLIVTPYTGVVLGGRRRGLTVGAMMALTYGLLYVLVSAQHASLLLGSLALLIAIAGLMYLTRRIDWYAYGDGAGPVRSRGR